MRVALDLLTLDQADAADLGHWLRSADFQLLSMSGNGTLGVGETVAIIGASSAALHPFVQALKAWAQARRTSVEVVVDANRSIRVEGPGDLKSTISELRSLIRESQGEERDD